MIDGWNQLGIISKEYVLFLVIFGCWSLSWGIRFAVNRVRIARTEDQQSALRRCRRAAELVEYFSIVIVLITMLYLFRGIASALQGKYLGDSRMPGDVLIAMSIAQLLHVAAVGITLALILYTLQRMMRNDLRRLDVNGN